MLYNSCTILQTWCTLIVSYDIKEFQTFLINSIQVQSLFKLEKWVVRERRILLILIVFSNIDINKYRKTFFKVWREVGMAVLMKTRWQCGGKMRHTRTTQVTLYLHLFFVFLVFYVYHHFSDHDRRLVQKAMIGITLLLEDISPSAQQNQVLPVSNLAQWVGM